MNNSASTRRISSIAIEYNGNDKGFARLVHTQNLFSSEPQKIYEEMKTVADRNTRIHKWALTGYISVPHDAVQMSDEELCKIALESLRRIGMTDENQALLHIHGSAKNKHIHYIVNRIKANGKCTVKSANIGKHFGTAVREVLRAKNIQTDLQYVQRKKEAMIVSITESLRRSANFDQFVSRMAMSGYRTTLSQNVKDGISGMRIVRLEDINDQTQRQYLAGFKLSEITSKLKISEMKEIYSIKTFLMQNRDSFDSFQTLKKASENAGMTVRFLLSEDRSKIADIYIRFNDQQASNGYFRNGYMGFRIGDIDPELNVQILFGLNGQIMQKGEENQFDKSENILQSLGEIVEKLMKPSYASPDQQMKSKKRSIYDEEPKFRRKR